MIISKRVLIHGRVQGVWYRGWTVQQAQALNLSGWVRNLSDGGVEALFHGAADRVQTMIDACWQGPAAAQVSTVGVENCADIPAAGFHQRPTF
ncbi:acylphosphatase [Magnetospirillum sulfuroxidans]|uniref:acylphosphatase n=1 Tax=Magnetospirillum sulfuroxidans TaxID=611300 RepID=A0ABS5IES6_9PROT|nr:acylphosphatase [Magnetospirillum sulfuroxidans]MBR9972917.1 acylphosphatase [Magnetospirillum sulfuroxidans]